MRAHELSTHKQRYSVLRLLSWRWMFTAVAVPSIVFFLSALSIPESPHWLAKAGNNEQARRTLARIGGERYGEKALAEIRSALGTEAQAGMI